MLTGSVDAAIFKHHLFGFGKRVAQLQEFFDQMTADVTAQDFVRNVRAAALGENVLDGATDVGLGIDKSAVDVEHIDRECRDQFIRLAAALCRLRAAFEHTRETPRRVRFDYLLRAVTAR